MPAEPPPVVLRRALRGRCPSCGVGPVFDGRWTNVRRCAGCGWAFERGPGHWVGGNEVNLLVTFPVSVAALAVPAVALGPSWWTAAAGGLLALVLGIAAHRPARCLFFAIDYLVDPVQDPSHGDGDGRGRGDDPAPAPPPGSPEVPVPPRVRVVELPVPDPAPRPDAEPIPAPGPAHDPAQSPIVTSAPTSGTTIRRNRR